VIPTRIFTSFVGLWWSPLHAVSLLLICAKDAHVKKLVLSHRMLRTLGNESQTESEIRKRYPGPLQFANDLDCLPVR